MATQELGWITNFIWGIADDVLRDVYVRGKYRDMVLGCPIDYWPSRLPVARPVTQ